MIKSGRFSPWLKTPFKFFARNAPLRPCRLLCQDLESIAARYVSDWATIRPFPVLLASFVYIFFANLFPALTFANDLYPRTGQNWGPIEVIFSTGLCGTVHSIFSVQPLTILSVTGPFSVLAENIYTLGQNSLNVDFLPMMTWTLIHTGWMLILLAIFNAYEWTMVYVTNFTCEIFGLLTSIFYFHKAVAELQEVHQALSFASFLYGIIACTGTLILALVLNYAEKWQPVFGRRFRKALKQYAAVIAIGVFVAISKAPPEIRQEVEEEPVRTSGVTFRPSNPDRSQFFVSEAWSLAPAYIFGAMLPAILITMLLFFDHNISTIICTTGRYGVRKPSGLTQPIIILGITTAACGILGIPPANGLLPQSPFHSESLMYEDPSQTAVEQLEDGIATQKPGRTPPRKEQVLEQRWTNFLQSGIALAFIAPPLQKILGYTPTTVLAGLFLFMCWQNICTNPLLTRTIWLLTPPSQLPALPAQVTHWPVHAYTILQIFIAIVIFVTTMTPAGPGFPILVFALVPFRLLVMKRIWSRQVLRFVDGWACKDGTPEHDGDDEDDRRASSSLTENPGETPIWEEMTENCSYDPGLTMADGDYEYRPSGHERRVTWASLPTEENGSGRADLSSPLDAINHPLSSQNSRDFRHTALHLRPSQFQLC